jgi:hypothetical protein
MPEVVADVLKTVRTFGDEKLEFEFRFGHRSGAFKPGVNAAAWARLKRVLDDSLPCTHAVTTERIDTNGSKLVVDGDGREVCVIHKKRVCHTDMDVEGSPWCVRASTCLEVREDVAQDNKVRHSYVRRKERWSYVTGAWVIDLTKVHGNMPHQKDDDTESHEVEVELADKKQLLTMAMRVILSWGWSIVSDLSGILQNGEVAVVDDKPTMAMGSETGSRLGCPGRRC